MPDDSDTRDKQARDRETTRGGTDRRFAAPLRGVDVDAETRCAHFDDEVDVIALRFGCCAGYYPCFRCHEAVADHDPEVWPKSRFDEPAVLCGVCRETITAAAYIDGGESCPHCDAAFNPGCRQHRDRYFETA